MIDADIIAAGGDAKKASVEGTTGMGLLWLKRALGLISGMLEAMLADPSKELAACVQAGYDASLRPHHNFVMKGTFKVRPPHSHGASRARPRRSPWRPDSTPRVS